MVSSFIESLEKIF